MIDSASSGEDLQGESGLHPKLIKANIALFKGARSETRRLLQEYQSEWGSTQEADPHRPLVMWLDAQAQNDREMRLERLRTLVAIIESDNAFAQLARAYLEEEDRYATQIDPGAQQSRSGITVFGASLVQVIFFMIIGGILAFIGISALDRRDVQPVSILVEPTSVPLIQSTAPALPDRSQALVADSYTARYPAGILQLTAFENDSERVLDIQSLTTVDPVPGARFYALKIVYECRAGICDDPPQADLAVELETGNVIAARTDVGLAGEHTFESIALGRTTTGWAVFEIPVASPVSGLVILPTDGDDPEAQPLKITIP